MNDKRIYVYNLLYAQQLLRPPILKTTKELWYVGGRRRFVFRLHFDVISDSIWTPLLLHFDFIWETI